MIFLLSYSIASHCSAFSQQQTDCMIILLISLPHILFFITRFVLLFILHMRFLSQVKFIGKENNEWHFCFTFFYHYFSFPQVIRLTDTVYRQREWRRAKDFFFLSSFFYFTILHPCVLSYCITRSYACISPHELELLIDKITYASKFVVIKSSFSKPY